MIRKVLKEMYRSDLWRPKKRRSSLYRFSLVDAWLYASALTWSIPRVKQIGIDGDLLILQIGPHQFAWPQEFGFKELPYLYNEVFLPPYCNPHSYSHNRCKVLPGDVVLDVGACEGFFSLHAARMGASVLACEPVPQVARALKKTAEFCTGPGRMEVYAGLIGANTGMERLKLDCIRPYESRMGIDSGDGIETPMRTVDSLVGSVIPRLDFLKIDVEGAEVQVIQGAANALREFRPRVAVAVYHHHSQAQEVRQCIKEILPGCGVRMRGMYAWDRCEPRPYMLYVSPGGF